MHVRLRYILKIFSILAMSSVVFYFQVLPYRMYLSASARDHVGHEIPIQRRLKNSQTVEIASAQSAKRESGFNHLSVASRIHNVSPSGRELR